jgi:hypothetical protein
MASLDGGVARMSWDAIVKTISVPYTAAMADRCCGIEVQVT